MQHVSVTSSNIKSICYEDGTLEVLFSSGGLYSYRGVPKEVFNAFAQSTSKGKFFASRIKNAGYECVKL